MELRFRIVGIFLIVAALALLGRLFYWQIINGESLARQARAQQTSRTSSLAPRGNILASDGSWLAAATDSWLAYASKPELTESPRKIANQLSPFFIDENEEDRDQLILDESMRVEGLLNKKDLVWIPLKPKLSTDTKKNIDALDIGGIGFDLTEARYYPEASAAAHLMGFVGKDDDGTDKGYFGLEGYYNLMLSGRPGYLERESDAVGTPIIHGVSKEIQAVGGVDLLTFIDKTVQIAIEKELAEGIELYGASEGTIIVMDPKTGGIMAMASSPSYDPLNYTEYGSEFFRNPSISNAFEPGSIFKPLIMAAGLDAGVIKPNTKCDVCDGPYKVDKYEIKTWNNKYNPDSTMIDVIKNSDNVGMAFVGEKLGADLLYDYLDKFGIGRPTEIDLQGEANPKMRPKGTWNIVDLATTTFGQGIAVTPIQMIRAIAAIANDGVVVKPRVVQKLIKDSWEQEISTQQEGRVLSTKAAKEITLMMIEAVKNGEAKWAVPSGFKIAGKTGTAEIPIGGRYDEEKTIASFVGFAPADNPKFVMLVTLREPQSSPWASETAAPLWFDIALDLFPYFGIQPEK